MNKKEIIDNILNTFQKQVFYNWYTTGDFNKWLNREQTTPEDDQEIKDTIERLFNIKGD